MRQELDIVIYVWQGAKPNTRAMSANFFKFYLLKFGLIMGLGLCGFYAIQYSADLTMTRGVGLTAWAIILGVLVWAMQLYSRQHEKMSFGRGVGLTAGICLIAGSLEGIFKALYVSYFNPEMVTAMQNTTYAQMEANPDLSEEAINRVIGFMQIIENPVNWFLFALGTTMLLGLIFGLILSAIYKK